MRLEVLDDHPCTLGESPVWDRDRGALVWVDILASDIHTRGLGGSARHTEQLPEAVGSLAPRRDGGWVLATASGLALRDGDEPPRLLATYDELDGEPARVPVRGNDGGVDPDGRFWFGTVALDMAPGVASLYRLDGLAEGATRVLDGVSISNGLGWSPDGTRQYYIDSATQRIEVFDLDRETGAITGRRPLVEIPSSRGAPDGLAVDADGCLWVALFGGGAVRRYTPDGRHDLTLPLPTSRVTSCAFVGDALDLLAITTATVGLDAPGPEAGRTYLADVGATGLPVPAAAV